MRKISQGTVATWRKSDVYSAADASSIHAAVVDHECGGFVEHAPHGGGDGLVQAVGAELGCQLVDGPGRLDFRAGGRRDERQPRQHLGRDLLDAFPEEHSRRRGVRVVRDVEDRAQDAARREVRTVALERFAEQSQHTHVAALRRELQRQAALADADVADELDHRAVPGAGGVEPALQHLELVAPADERQVVALPGRRGFAHGEHLARVDRPALALHIERCEREYVELRKCGLEHGSTRDTCARFGARHQTGGKVHRIAHDRVRASPR